MMVGKKIAIIGVGNCGSQVANLAEKRYSTIFDCIYINTSDEDLKMVDSPHDEFKFKICENEDDEVEGSGKNRDKMKEYLESDIQRILGDGNLQECIVEKKYCFIVTSTAGGTGSGAGPVLLEFIRQLFPDTYFILVAVIPKINSSSMELGNTMEYMHELYDIIGADNVTYMIYDNDTAADMADTSALEHINSEIVEDLRVLSGVDNFPTPYESIDAADMEAIITTPGRLIVTRLTKNITEKAMEDSDLNDMIIRAIKKSSHAETDRNKKVVHWGIITYFTEPVNRLYKSSLEKLCDFIGTPDERFNHNAINKQNEQQNFLYLIASGLSPINDRVIRIKNKIDELQKKKAGDGASQYVMAKDEVNTSYNATAMRNREQRRANQAEQINKSDIFSKFK